MVRLKVTIEKHFECFTRLYNSHLDPQTVIRRLYNDDHNDYNDIIASDDCLILTQENWWIPHVEFLVKKTHK